MPKQNIPEKKKHRKRVVFEIDLKPEDKITRLMKTSSLKARIKSILKKKRV